MIDDQLLKNLENYIAENESILVLESNMNLVYEAPKILSPDDLIEFVNTKREPTFQEVLFKFIVEKNISDTDVYKKAWIDRKHFSKIRSNPHYNIGKNSVIALAMALELTQNETDELLQSAGFALSHNKKTDLVIRFCIDRNIYSLYDINDALVYLKLKPLSNVN